MVLINTTLLFNLLNELLFSTLTYRVKLWIFAKISAWLKTLWLYLLNFVFCYDEVIVFVIDFVRFIIFARNWLSGINFNIYTSWLNSWLLTCHLSYFKALRASLHWFWNRFSLGKPCLKDAVFITFQFVRVDPFVEL